MTSWLIHLRFGLAYVGREAPFAGVAMDGRMRGTIQRRDGAGCRNYSSPCLTSHKEASFRLSSPSGSPALTMAMNITVGTLVAMHCSHLAGNEHRCTNFSFYLAAERPAPCSQMTHLSRGKAKGPRRKGGSLVIRSQGAQCLRWRSRVS